jgi:hypothetical protein
MVTLHSGLPSGNLAFGHDLADQYRSSVDDVPVQYKFDLTISNMDALTANGFWDLVFLTGQYPFV